MMCVSVAGVWTLMYFIARWNFTASVNTLVLYVEKLKYNQSDLLKLACGPNIQTPAPALCLMS